MDSCGLDIMFLAGGEKSLNKPIIFISLTQNIDFKDGIQINQEAINNIYVCRHAELAKRNIFLEQC
jgi:hypothetical protein